MKNELIKNTKHPHCQIVEYKLFYTTLKLLMISSTSMLGPRVDVKLVAKFKSPFQNSQAD